MTDQKTPERLAHLGLFSDFCHQKPIQDHMGYLKDIMLEHLRELTGTETKLAKQFCNKINDGYYPDSKNVEKLRKFSTTAMDAFLLGCLTEYDLTERTVPEHHDIVSLRAVWVVLSFSQEPEVLSYLDRLTDRYINGTPIFLNSLFQIFSFPAIQHPLCKKICTYYDRIISELPSYQLLRQLGIEPTDHYNWSIQIVLTTDGEWLVANDISDEERTRRFCLSIDFGSPHTMGDTYSIKIENSSSATPCCISISESKLLTIGIDKDKIDRPDLLHLSTWIEQVEKILNVRFIFDNIAYLSASKGINRRILKDWIHKRFQIAYPQTSFK